ncbi:MAG: glycosyltransferase family 2 protein [bacterium]|nr:glycosyltransferase family 2 protein [bacterium]
MDDTNLPAISVIMPTLNAAKTLEESLKTIREQDYPQDKIEIVVADGGSKDATVEVARRYGAKIFPNPLKTGEAGKAVATKKATGELLALIDSDNFLPQRDWFRRMVEPFGDPAVVGSEPWEYTWRASDSMVSRYWALVGVNDPLCLFLGNYDRRGYLSRGWTSLSLEQTDKGGWLEVGLEKGKLPTIGANGTIFRRSFLSPEKIGDYLFDIDIISERLKDGQVKFAKVKIGIIHTYARSLSDFWRKQKRRVADFLYHQKIGDRSYGWDFPKRSGLGGIFDFLRFIFTGQSLGLLIFVLDTVLIFPLLWQAIKGFWRKPDAAWLVHPVACWLTLLAYTRGVLLAKLSGEKELDRTHYRQ